MSLEFDFIFAALWPSLSSLSERNSLRSCLVLHLVSVLLDFIFAAFGPSFASFAAVEAEFEVERRHLLELEGFFEDGFFVFGAFGPASSSVLVVVVIGGLLVLRYLIRLIGRSRVPLPILFLVVVIIFILEIHRLFLLLAFRLLLFFPLQLFDFFQYLVVLLGGNDNFGPIFLALDLYFREVADMGNVGLSLRLEGYLAGVLSALPEILACVIEWFTLTTLGIIGNEKLEFVVGVLPHEVENATFEGEQRHWERFLLFIFNIVLNC